MDRQPLTNANAVSPPLPTQKPSAWELLKQSYAILRSDKELTLFPVMAGLFSFIGFVVTGMLYVAVRWGLMHGNQNQAVDYVFLFLLYVISYSVNIYFNVGLSACVLSKFQGGDATYKFGISEAKKRKGKILGYAVLAATVGLILQIIAERLKLLGRIAANILGAVWSIATIFIAPVLITTDLTPMDSVKESARIFRSVWGDTVKGSIGFFFIEMIGAIVCFIPMVIGIAVGNAAVALAGVLVSVVALILLVIVISTCTGIFRTALYHYAVTKQVPPGFSPNLQSAVK